MEGLDRFLLGHPRQQPRGMHPRMGFRASHKPATRWRPPPLLTGEPGREDSGVKPLRSRPGFRRRVGGYRVIFERDDKTRTISDPQVILVIPMYAGYGGMGGFAGEPRQTVVMPDPGSCPGQALIRYPLALWNRELP